jgi:lysozyme family protein
MPMAEDDIDRRDALRWGIGLPAGLVMSRGSLAQERFQGGEKINILDVQVPDEIAGIKLPAKQLNLLRVVRAIVALEKEADQRGLPYSRLAFNNGPELSPTATSLYQTALPRLVALVDRSEGNDPDVADKAGALLAEIHATEHEIPEALKPEVVPVSPSPPSVVVPAPAPAPAPAAAPVAPLVMNRARNYPALKEEYRTLFNSMTFRPQFQESLNWHVTLISAARLRYEQVGKLVGVPWYFIGAIHGLEASFNFRAHLHNGDFPLKARTRQVPAGRPLVWLPPDDWESSAKDALRLLGFTGQSDWSLERTLYRLEAYNGFGYRKVGVPTPYLWAYSNHYDRGKFVADGKWNAKARSQQCGAAVLLKAIANAGLVSFS